MHSLLNQTMEHLTLSCSAISLCMELALIFKNVVPRNICRTISNNHHSSLAHIPYRTNPESYNIITSNSIGRSDHAVISLFALNYMQQPETKAPPSNLALHLCRLGWPTRILFLFPGVQHASRPQTHHLSARK